MPTSDERREVARRIRNNIGEQASWVIPWAVFNDADSHGDRETMERLADLIDPTCHMVDTDHEYEDSIRCDVCQMTFNRTWEPFKFCPNCGARVVDDDD